MNYEGLFPIFFFLTLSASEPGKAPIVFYNNLLTPEMLAEIDQGQSTQPQQTDSQLVLIVLRQTGKTTLPEGAYAARPITAEPKQQEKEITPADQPQQSCCAGCCKKTGKVCSCCLQCCSKSVDCFSAIASCCQIFTQCCRK